VCAPLKAQPRAGSAPVASRTPRVFAEPRSRRRARDPTPSRPTPVTPARTSVGRASAYRVVKLIPIKASKRSRSSTRLSGNYESRFTNASFRANDFRIQDSGLQPFSASPLTRKPDVVNGVFLPWHTTRARARLASARRASIASARTMTSHPETRAGTASAASAPLPTTPFAPGQANIWTDILQHNKAEAKAQGDVGRPDACLFVVGATGSGKTTLLRRLLYGTESTSRDDRPGEVSTPKPGEGVEYHYARKSRPNVESDRKDVAHVFEISGSRTFADEITSKENVFFGPRQVTTATAVICVDLSTPREAVPTLEYWLDAIRAAVGKTFEKLTKRGSRLPDQLRNRHRKQFHSCAIQTQSGETPGTRDAHASRRHQLQEHCDLTNGSLRPDAFSGVQIIVACTKSDAHRKEDAEPRRVLSRALRRLAHVNGASLFYVGDLNARTAAREDSQTQFQKLRAFVNHCVFIGADKAFPKKIVPEFDHLKDVVVLAGQDSASAVGQPRKQDQAEFSANHLSLGGDDDVGEIWRWACRKMFPPENATRERLGSPSWVENATLGKETKSGTEKKNASLLDSEKYAEPEIDAVRDRKTEELETFIKQQGAVLRQHRA